MKTLKMMMIMEQGTGKQFERREYFLSVDDADENVIFRSVDDGDARATNSDSPVRMK